MNNSNEQLDFYIGVDVSKSTLNRYIFFPSLGKIPAQAKKTLVIVLSLDAALFLFTILLSAWLTGPAANG